MQWTRTCQRFVALIAGLAAVTVHVTAGYAEFAASEVGTGVVTGSLSYGAGEGLPVGTGCDLTSWSASASGAIVWVPPGSPAAQPVTVTATGGSSCAFLTEEGGTISLSISATASSCSAVGAYLRLATHVLVSVQGSCTPSASASVILNAESVPDSVQSVGGGREVATSAFVAHIAIYASVV